jgi:hypothetical protein
MPVATLKHRFTAFDKFLDQLVQRRNYLVAVSDGECATRAKIILDVYND